MSIVGRNEQYYSEDNGNFKILFKDSVDHVRLRITKKGYHSYDHTFNVPESNIIIQLAK